MILHDEAINALDRKLAEAEAHMAALLERPAAIRLFDEYRKRHPEAAGKSARQIIDDIVARIEDEE